jgi:hypothetical protein
MRVQLIRDAPEMHGTQACSAIDQVLLEGIDQVRLDPPGHVRLDLAGELAALQSQRIELDGDRIPVASKQDEHAN